jgi:hypothetical protein
LLHALWLYFRSRRWRQHIFPKRRSTFTRVDGVTNKL